MRSLRILFTLALSVGALVACSNGSTDVSGLSGGTSGASGPSEATGPTGPTGATSVTGISGDFSGPVSIVLSGDTAGIPVERSFFSCDGVLGTWRYLFNADFGAGLVFEVDSTVDLSSGAGTLVFGDTIEVPQAGSFTWEDTVDLEVAGTADAPTLVATNADVKISGSIPIPADTFKSFTKDEEFPVVLGAVQC